MARTRNTKSINRIQFQIERKLPRYYIRALDVHLLSRFNSVLKYILWWNSGYNYIYSLKSNRIVRWLGASVTWFNYKMRLYSVRCNKIVTFGPDRIPFWTLYYGTDAPSSYTLSLRVRKWNSSHTQSSPQSSPQSAFAQKIQRRLPLALHIGHPHPTILEQGCLVTYFDTFQYHLQGCRCFSWYCLSFWFTKQVNCVLTNVFHLCIYVDVCTCRATTVGQGRPVLPANINNNKNHSLAQKLHFHYFFYRYVEKLE